MTLLVDAHVLLWALFEPDRLPPNTRGLLTDHESTPTVSAVAIWEISIKRTLGKLKAPGDLVHTLDRMSIATMPVRPVHAELAGILPLHHRDPFDRMLIAQSKIEGLPIVTADKTFDAYDVETIWD